ncbi:MAG: hypothetical protein ACRCUT_00970 [Spirochaetota bacterium]
MTKRNKNFIAAGMMIFLLSFRFFSVYTDLIWKQAALEKNGPALLMLTGAIFSLSLLSWPLVKFLGEKILWAVSTAGIAVSFFILQILPDPSVAIWSKITIAVSQNMRYSAAENLPDPMLYMWISGAGIVFFLWLLPLLLQKDEQDSFPAGAAALPLAMIGHSIISPILYGFAFGNEKGSISISIAAFLSLLAAAFAVLSLPRFSRKAGSPGWQKTVGAGFIGSWVYLCAGVLQNPEYLIKAVNFPHEGSALFFIMLNASGFFIIRAVSRKPAARSLTAALLYGVVLAGSLVLMFSDIRGGLIVFTFASLSSWAAVAAAFSVFYEKEFIPGRFYQLPLCVFLGFCAVFILMALHESITMAGTFIIAGVVIALTASAAVFFARREN